MIFPHPDFSQPDAKDWPDWIKALIGAAVGAVGGGFAGLFLDPIKQSVTTWGKKRTMRKELVSGLEDLNQAIVYRQQIYDFHGLPLNALKDCKRLETIAYDQYSKQDTLTVAKVKNYALIKSLYVQFKEYQEGCSMRN